MHETLPLSALSTQIAGSSRALAAGTAPARHAAHPDSRGTLIPQALKNSW